VLVVALAASGLRASQAPGTTEVASAADRRIKELAPGSSAALYGSRLTSDPAKTTVEVNGQRASVSYASDTQINFVVPDSIRDSTARIVVTSSTGAKITAQAPLRDVSPALFTRDATGSGEVSAVEAVRRTLAPFAVGPGENLIALLGTGIHHAKEVVVRVGGIPVEVRSFGPEGKSEGLDQVIIRIPSAFSPRGALSLEVTAGGRTTGPGVTLTLVNAK
jgi:uncharacterized protein (TIGR03437 family)